MTANTFYSAKATETNISDNQIANESLPDESCNHFANWKAPLIWVELCVMSCIIILNLLGLFSLIRPSRYINPSFKIYIGNLLLANMSFAVLENPLDLLYELSCDRWVMNWATCDLFIYCNYAVTAWAMHAHVLITLNRLWAVVFPYSYRRKHSPTLALVLCCGALVYIHVWTLPGIVIDSHYYRDSAEKLQCELNVDAQKIWAAATQISLFLAPIAFVAISYVFIVVKLRAQSKVKQSGRTVDMASRPSTRRRNSSATLGEELANGNGQVNDSSSDNRERGTRQNKRTFFILTSLTCSLIITWTPYEIHQMLDILGFATSDELNECLDILWTAQAVLDPLLSTHITVDLKRICSRFLRK